jgi:NAD(P)-dependent dehydrogenase (short-subunit alcohol dehydrogenase family)
LPIPATELLLPLLVGAAAGRIVNVVSEFYSRKLDLDNLQGQRKYSYFGAYSASELGKVLFTTELARRIKASGATVVSVSPGPARTNFSRPSGVLGLVLGVMQHTPMVKPAGQAARGIAWAATAPELADNSGALYMRGKQLSLKGAAKDQSLAARVWSISEQQTGVDPARSAVAAITAAGASDA